MQREAVTSKRHAVDPFAWWPCQTREALSPYQHPLCHRKPIRTKYLFETMILAMQIAVLLHHCIFAPLHEFAGPLAQSVLDTVILPCPMSLWSLPAPVFNPIDLL